MPPLPIALAYATVFEPVSIVPPLISMVTVRPEMSAVLLLVYCRVPPFSPIVVPLPRLPRAAKLSTPPFTFTAPEKVLAVVVFKGRSHFPQLSSTQSLNCRSR